MKARILVLAGCALLFAGRAEALRIVQPAAGTVVKPGEMVTVRAALDPGELATEAGVLSDGALTPVPIAGGFFEAPVRIPIAGVGEEILVAYAVLSGGGAVMARLSVTIDPGPLRGLVISVPPMFVAAGQTAPTQVRGVFMDGVARDLSAADLGTTYESSDPSVLGVSPGGVVQARTSGKATLTVKSRGETETAEITVKIPVGATNRIPTLTPGPPQTAGPEQIVVLSVTASDPDGDKLEYIWEQVGGRVVVLHNRNSPNPEFVSPRTTVQQELEFVVAVRDAHGAMTLPVLVKVTVTPAVANP